MLLEAVERLLDTIGKRNGHRFPETNNHLDEAALRMAVWKLVKDRATKEYDEARKAFVEFADGDRVVHSSRLVTVTANYRDGARRLDRSAVVRYAIENKLDPEELVSKLSVKGEPSVSFAVSVKV